ncbi:MAG: MmgE/PrpD family protein [Kiloniellales bacterium]
MTLPLAQTFADWSSALTWADVPEEVRRACRRAWLDCLGVTIAGGAHPSLRRLAAAQPRRKGPCSLALAGQSDAASACLVNGMAAHAWDFDDTSYTGIMHGTALVFPVVLALCEERGLSEGDALLALVVGSEVTYCLAEVCGHQHYFKGWWSSVTLGLVGATAAAAKLMGLDPLATRHALALAAAASGGGKAAFGSDAKPYLIGECARRALGFAEAAAAGLTGPAEVFEDSRGFLALLNDGKSNPEEVEWLGKRWRLTDPGLFFKTSPVCSAAHAAIEATATLLAKAGADWTQVAAIHAEVPDLVAVSLVYPDPITPQEAQFSLPYALACSCLNGRVRLQDLAPEALQAAGARRLMQKVTMQVADDLSSAAMRQRYPESARVTLTLNSRERLDGFCGEAYGMPKNALTNRDLTKKFADCLAYAGSDDPGVSLETSDLLELAVEALSRRSRPLEVSQTGRST